MSKLAAKWASVGHIGEYIRQQSVRTLDAYRSQPNLVAEHANTEEDTARGGYAHRQLFELVQNSADSLALSSGGQIWIRLTPTHLYCADEGQAIDKDGVRALMFSHLSPKRGTKEIGRFGLGFKSVLGVTDMPEFYSRSGCFRFDRAGSASLIREVVANAERYPALRLPESIDPMKEAASDSVLREMMDWAVNIVRLPLKSAAHLDLDEQIADFPSEVLLFVEHVRRLVLQTDTEEAARVITLQREEDQWILDDARSRSRWTIEVRLHRLSSDAKSDSRSLDDTDEVPIWWAAPIDRLNDPGRFWAFFPTQTTSLLAGILNAPWKTNEDRQNLLSGPYNDELIDAAAAMVADVLPGLSTRENPARHLDALPRRYEFGDNDQINRLRSELNSILRDRELIPDQVGRLCKLLDLSYAPAGVTDDALQRWAAFDNRPSNWVHHRVLTRNRLARLDQLSGPMIADSIPRASVAVWLEALVENARRQQQEVAARVDELSNRTWMPPEEIAQAIASLEHPVIEACVQASMAAVQTAALIPKSVRDGQNLGQIVFASDGRWFIPNADVVRLGELDGHRANVFVHPQLESDPTTVGALKELGLQKASSETALADLASNMLGPWAQRENTDENWHEFWRLVRNTGLPKAARIIQSHRFWRDTLLARTLASGWHPLYKVLLPGPIVPGDGSRDSDVAIDVEYHSEDLDVLRSLGAADSARPSYRLSNRSSFAPIVRRMKDTFSRQHSSQLNRTPQSDRLFLNPDTTSGPLDVMTRLSDHGKATYTWNLLDVPSTYEPSRIWHDVWSCACTDMRFESPAITVLKEHGRLETEDGLRKLSDALEDPPRDFVALRKLLSHPQAESIRKVFQLPDDDIVLYEPIGIDDPISLIDVWPGLVRFLPSQHLDLRLIRCDQFIDTRGSPADLNCITMDRWVYVRRSDDEVIELGIILREIGLPGALEQIGEILNYQTPEQIRANRAAVRACATNEERLLAAVGEDELLRGLPQGLIDILADSIGPLIGTDIASAAIATFHTGALREYRHAIHHLNPPRQWAGRGPAIDFVRSLGFSEEWAGEPNTRREPFVEVAGPLSLPCLHDYQRRIVENVREVIRSDGAIRERRGMISMPTGSGKTRVAVQSIVEAIKEDGFEGGILWVADRDELCEQAVEAWRQVWASEGKEATQLRISRMWAGQPSPLPVSHMHVIVATIHTLYAKLSRHPEAYEFLSDFKILVFDEAHRSVARTFTSVMDELGLSVGRARWRNPLEAFLIGLTATPYRGYDESETQRLVNRYGSNRLDAGAFASDDPEDVIRELQGMDVLALADHTIIEGGQFQLSADELRQSTETPWLPRSVESRIAGDSNRTRRIVEAFNDDIDPDWSTLIFATSVEHAQTVAALLTSMGIKSRAVSSDTDSSSRRSIVEQFRSGDIRALVNYGIFREGFDAPRTRAIIVARPVYSPNLYFQMIGRGLRGVKNGGNERCLILNVSDNIDNFEQKLAFSELDWLWS